jgi:small subunit ribosomal protein S4e
VLLIYISDVCFLLPDICELSLLQAPKPSSGPHKSRECLPLILILRNRLKYALTYREVQSILMQRHIEVDGKVRTAKTFPAGFMGMLRTSIAKCSLV